MLVQAKQQDALEAQLVEYLPELSVRVVPEDDALA
jgi:hypothetical protein